MAEPIRVQFESGGSTCVGYLYEPQDEGEPRPCVLLCHGLGGTQDTPSIRVAAQTFVGAGFSVLTFDYRGFGESEGEPRQVVDIEAQLNDIHAAIRFARSQPSIDPERIALWGSSLGGGHVVVVAAADPRIAAVVSQVPFNGFPREVEGVPARTRLELLGVMVWDAIRGWLGMSPRYIPAVGSYGDLAVMPSSEAQRTIAAMNSKTWRNEIAPRSLWGMIRYKPSDSAPHVTAPLLVSIGNQDHETPPELSREIAERAPRGETIEYPIAHFQVYEPKIREQVLADQVAFLRRHLTDGE